jgi:hypothetical protein
MMPRRVGRAVSVRCPFYRRDTPRTVTCEGLVDRSTIRLGFGLEADCSRHMRVFCCRAFDKCEIYQAVMSAKYSE